MTIGCADEETTNSGKISLNVRCQLVSEGYGPAGATPEDVEPVATGLDIPWSIDWLGDGSMLATERTGAILRVLMDGRVTAIATLDLAAATAEGGLLGLAIHPDHAINRWFYIYHTAVNQGALTNQVERWVLSNDRLSAVPDRLILTGIPELQFHNGGRIRLGPDGLLYVGTGDAGEPERAQDLEYLGGKILRITDQGDVPDDNPFPGSPVFALGIRNTQGFDWRADGRMVVTDHGPSGLPYEGGREGHDEINVLEPGANLGWPDQYACEQGAGRVSPSMVWAEAMPPGGTAIYTGDQIPDWTNDVFIGVLGIGGAIGHLHRIGLSDDGNVDTSETYFLGQGFGRIRDVAMGPDGHLYFTTSNCDGRAECAAGDAIFRVVPSRG